MKKFMFVLMLIISIYSCISCSNTSENNNNNYPAVVNVESWSIPFSFDNVDTVIYIYNDDKIIMHYSDCDFFDYDKLAFITGSDEWYGEYVIINIKDELLQEVLTDYNEYKNIKNCDIKEQLNNKYVIIERDIIFQDYTTDVTFYIEYNTEEE